MVVKIKNLTLLKFIFFLILPMTAKAQTTPSTIPFQAIIKDASNNLITHTTALIRAQYLGYTTPSNQWCVISEEAFTVPITSGYLKFSLGSGVFLGSPPTLVGSFNTQAEFLTQNSTANSLSDIFALSTITWDTHCKSNNLTDTFSSWTAETSNQNLTSARALRLNIELPNLTLTLTPAFDFDSTPYSLNTLRTTQLRGTTGMNIGQIFKWNGTQWTGQSDLGSPFTAGNGVTLSASNFSLLNQGITAGLIATGAVNSDKLDTNSIITNKIAAGAVTSDKLASDSVVTATLADNSVVENSLAAGAISDSHISGLAWGTKISSKPTTLAGYGITDGASSLSGILSKSGGTMTGVLNLPALGLTVGSSQLRVATDGSSGFRIGVNRPSPESLVDVNGSLRVGEDLGSCSGSIEGAIRYNSPHLQICNGSSWQSVATGSGTPFVNNGNSFSANASVGTDDNYSLVFESNNTNQMIVTNQGNVGIGTQTPGNGTRLKINGQLSGKSFSTTDGNINFTLGNSGVTTFDCSTPISLSNLRAGNHYMLVVTDPGNTQCDFNTTAAGDDGATLTYRFSPANGERTLNTHTVYHLSRMGNTIYVSWLTGY